MWIHRSSSPCSWPDKLVYYCDAVGSGYAIAAALQGHAAPRVAPDATALLVNELGGLLGNSIAQSLYLRLTIASEHRASEPTVVVARPMVILKRLHWLLARGFKVCGFNTQITASSGAVFTDLYFETAKYAAMSGERVQSKSLVGNP